MAEINTNISADLAASGYTKKVARHLRGGMVNRIARPVWTIASGQVTNDTIRLDLLSPKEMLALDLCNFQCSADPGTGLSIDIGFQAYDGGGSAVDTAGNTVTDDPDYWVDNANLGSGGNVLFNSGLTARHTAPVLFKEPVWVYATLASASTLTTDVEIQFNLYYIY